MSSLSVRPAAVAGQFYPNDPASLKADILSYLHAAEAEAAGAVVPKAIIAPHAGYVYSGAIAAQAYARLRPARDTITRVVVLGPCHRVAVRGLAAPSVDGFDTPLGTVALDRAAIDDILSLPQVSTFDATHAQEHSLEVHLPFLQMVLGDFHLVPLVVGEASDDAVAEVLERLWGGPETLIVVSSDLTHYLDYDSAKRIDAKTSHAIEQLNAPAIAREHACGGTPVRGLLTVARRKGLRVRTLDVRNSGDTAGDKARVVGYGAWAFEENPVATATDFEEKTKALLAEHGVTLLRTAAASIENGLKKGRPTAVNTDSFPTPVTLPGACFVTLKIKGRLRGCIGSPEAHRPLVLDVAQNAFAAAFRDPRFPPLGADEVADVDVSVSVLSPSTPMTFTSETDLLTRLRPGIDGLIIADGARRALFLPAVWETLTTPKTFLGNLKAKAGLAPNHWSPTFKAWRFIAEEVSSKDLSTSIWTQ